MRLHSFTLLLACLLSCFAGKAQENDTLAEYTDAVNTGTMALQPAFSTDYSGIDSTVLAIKKHYKKISDLSTDLTAPYATDAEKVRAIFIWITGNIAYDCHEFHSNTGQVVSFTYKSQADLDAKRKKYYADYAGRVLRSRKAICEGYAVLFQELCRQNNIPCEIVVGRVSNNTAKIERVRGKKNFSTNHAWDKVKIGDSWYYVDPTWASGYCDKGVKKFYRSFNPYYYLTPADKLFLTHAENEKQTERRNNAMARTK